MFIVPIITTRPVAAPHKCSAVLEQDRLQPRVATVPGGSGVFLAPEHHRVIYGKDDHIRSRDLQAGGITHM